MRAHTNGFKNEISQLGKQINGRIYHYLNYNLITEAGDTIITEDNITLISEQINTADKELIDGEQINSINVIKNGQLLQSLMKECDFEIKNELKIGDMVNVQFGVLVNNEYEYLDYGNYIIYSKEYNADSQSWNYISYDKMLYSMIQYKPLNITYPCTIRSYISAIAERIGLTFANANDTFTNYNQQVQEELFENQSITYRDILDKLSEITASNIMINDDDELELGYPKETIGKILPDEYTQVDYIQGTGTQYIDTNYVPNENTIINVDFKSNKVSGEPFTSIFGTQYSANEGRLYCLLGTANNYQINIPRSTGDYAALYQNGTWLLNMTGDFLLTSRATYIANVKNKTFTINNTTWDLSSLAGTFVSPQYPLMIFTRNSAGTPNANCSKGLLYGAKIYEDTTLVRNFIPCYRNSDDEVGLYDLVNNVFYTNAGTGAFTYGEEVDYDIDTIDEGNLKDINVNFGETFGPINKVAITETDGGYEYSAQDDSNIEANGLTQINIVDNIFAFNGNSETIAQNILNKIKGLSYSINDFSTTGVCYYDFLDLFNVNIESVDYKCLLLNNEIKISQGLEENIYTEKYENSEKESDRFKVSDISNKQVKFQINKQKGEIEARVEKDNIINSINLSQEGTKILASLLDIKVDDVLDILAGNAINLTTRNITIDSDHLDIDNTGAIKMTTDSTVAGHGVIEIENTTTDMKTTFSGDNISNRYVSDNSIGFELNSQYLTLGDYPNGMYASYGRTDWRISDINDTSATYCNGGSLPYVSSDKRLKHNIENIDEKQSIGIIKNLKPISYSIKGQDKKHRGLIAQEVVDVLKENGIENEIYGIDEKGYYSLCYDEFIPDLINCVKYQQEQIEILQAKIENLEKEVK